MSLRSRAARRQFDSAYYNDLCVDDKVKQRIIDKRAAGPGNELVSFRLPGGKRVRIGQEMAVLLAISFVGALFLLFRRYG